MGRVQEKAPDLLRLFMFLFFSTPDKRRTMTSWKIPEKKEERKQRLQETKLK